MAREELLGPGLGGGGLAKTDPQLVFTGEHLSPVFVFIYTACRREV